jgi:hypothetical protein
MCETQGNGGSHAPLEVYFALSYDNSDSQTKKPSMMLLIDEDP